MQEVPKADASQEERLAGLTPSQMKALTAILSGATQAEAAEAAGVSRQRVSYWIHEDLNFRVNLKKEKLAVLRTARAGLAEGALEAVNFLRATLESSQADTGQKLKAASLLLSASGIDQAPAPWPVLNDVELLVSAELADATSQEHRTAQDQERIELEIVRSQRFDPKEAARLEAEQQVVSDQYDVVERQIRKLRSRRRTTAKQAARLDHLEGRLKELGQLYQAAENRVIQYSSLTNELKDLGPQIGGLSSDPDRNAVFLLSLRRERAADG